jgi:hypothetical protein
MKPTYYVVDHDPEAQYDEIIEAVRDALAYANEEGAGRMENKRFIEALMTRDVSVRQDVFLIAADTADQGHWC